MKIIKLLNWIKYISLISNIILSIKIELILKFSYQISIYESNKKYNNYNDHFPINHVMEKY